MCTLCLQEAYYNLTQLFTFRKSSMFLVFVLSEWVMLKLQVFGWYHYQGEVCGRKHIDGRIDGFRLEHRESIDFVLTLFVFMTNTYCMVYTAKSRESRALLEY